MSEFRLDAGAYVVCAESDGVQCGCTPPSDQLGMVRLEGLTSRPDALRRSLDTRKPLSFFLKCL